MKLTVTNPGLRARAALALTALALAVGCQRGAGADVVEDGATPGVDVADERAQETGAPDTGAADVVADASADVAADADVVVADVATDEGVVVADADDAGDAAMGPDVMLTAPGPVAPDFSLQDFNASSPTAGRRVSPRSQLGNVSAWYFGLAT